MAPVLLAQPAFPAYFGGGEPRGLWHDLPAELLSAPKPRYVQAPYCQQPPALVAPRQHPPPPPRNPLRLQLAPAGHGGQNVLPAPGDLRVDWQGRYAYIVSPEALEPGRPLPLLLALHGCWAEKSPADIADYVASYRRLANEAHIVVIVPLSREHTWDFITSQCTKRADLDFLEVAMNETRKLFPIDDGRIAVVGLSDGASYGLSLALNNPDVFQAAMVWATGFCHQPPGGAGILGAGPKLFMWHGTEDQVFNFHELALPLRDSLVANGYSVQYHAEEGGRHKGPSTDSEFMHTGINFWFALPRRA